MLVVDADSDGSKLPARGVKKPPPSTAIGIINSRGLFLIGCDELVPPIVELEPPIEGDRIVSVSDSLVDWRDNDPVLKIKKQRSSICTHDLKNNYNVHTVLNQN